MRRSEIRVTAASPRVIDMAIKKSVGSVKIRRLKTFSEPSLGDWRACRLVGEDARQG